MGLNQNGEYLTLLGGYYNNSDKSYKVKFPDAIDKRRSIILTIIPKRINNCSILPEEIFLVETNTGEGTWVLQERIELEEDEV